MTLMRGYLNMEHYHFLGGGSKFRGDVIEIMIFFDMGEGGVKKPGKKNSDVFYGQAKIQKYLFVFGSNENFKICFWDLLTFTIL